MLNGASIKIERGEFVSIMRHSGSGKLTFMNVIGCLDVLTKSAYMLDGIDVSGLDRDALADIRNSKIGFVFHGLNLLLLYNSTSAAERRQKALQALKALGIIHLTT